MKLGVLILGVIWPPRKNAKSMIADILLCAAIFYGAAVFYFQ